MQIMILQLPTIEALRNCGYESHIAQCETNTLDYSSTLFKASAASREKGDEGAAVALQLLSAACSLNLNPVNTREPFKPFAIFNGLRTAILGDFTKEHGKLFVELAPEIIDSELAARLADIAWLTARGINSANIAINNYIKSSLSSFCSKHWDERVDRLERAFRMAISIRNDEATMSIKNIMINHVDQKNERFHFLAAKRILLILMDLKKEDFSIIAERALLLANEIEKCERYDFQYSFIDIADRAFTSAKLNDRAQEARLLGAEVLVKKAKEATRPGNIIAAAHYYQQAISALQKCKGGQKERIKSLQPEFSKVIKSTYPEMKIFSIPIDVSGFAQKAINAMHGKPLESALLSFAYLIGPIPLKTLQEQVLDQSKELGFQYTANKNVYNGDGRLVAIIPPLLGSEATKFNIALDAACFEHASFHHSVFVRGMILPARDEILKSHQIGKNVLFEILQHCAFIPLDRLSMWVKGILAGFDNDFDVALHLLIPQFEHALRKLLESKGEIVWRIEPDTQFHTEKSLNELLPMNAAKEFFGEDLHFELCGLLIERTGHNIRNECSHGLMSDHNFYSPLAIYLWWRLFHIVVHLSLAIAKDNIKEKGADGDEKAKVPEILELE